jgi:hypothetical protein
MMCFQRPLPPIPHNPRLAFALPSPPSQNCDFSLGLCFSPYQGPSCGPWKSGSTVACANDALLYASGRKPANSDHQPFDRLPQAHLAWSTCAGPRRRCRIAASAEHRRVQRLSLGSPAACETTRKC